MASQPIADFLRLLTECGGLELTYEISPLQATAPELTVELSGPDTTLLIERNGELLHAVEHIAAKILRLEPEEHDRISFDAARFKATRDHELRLSAAAATTRVRETGTPYAFAVMTSRERRLLHLVLQESGLPTASSGDGPRRFVVLYPEGHVMETAPAPVIVDRTHQIRNTFRRR